MKKTLLGLALAAGTTLFAAPKATDAAQPPAKTTKAKKSKKHNSKKHKKTTTPANSAAPAK